MIIAGENDAAKNMTKTYISAHIFYQIVFIKMVMAEIAFSGHTNNRIYIIRNPFSRYIVNFYSNQAYFIKDFFCFSETVKSLLRPFYYLLLAFKGMSESRASKSINNISKPSVWVEYTHKDVVDFLFWKDHVNANDFDIVYYLDRPDTPAKEEIIKEIDKQSVKWIDAHMFSLLRYSQFNWKYLRRMLSGLYSDTSNLPFWYRALCVEYLFWYVLYKSVFEYFKVKMIIQHNDTLWKQEVIARAIEDAGGILMGFNWSNYPLRVTPTHLFPFHVLFLWGDVIKDFVLQGEHTCRYIMPSGIWLKGKVNESDKKIRLNDYTDFTITIFDSSVAYNIYQTPDDLSQFYLRLLELLEINQRWSAVVKGKNRGNTVFQGLPKGDLIAAKVNKFIKEDRLIMLDPAVSPVEASNYGHLSVCFGLNSAGIISAVYGNSVVMWDCSGWSEYPFYKDSSQKFIFQDINVFLNAIISFANGNKTIGDFSRWRKKFNYFNDYDAPKRVGGFIDGFMKKISITKDMNYSLDSAIEKYCADNELNIDKIH